MMPAMYMYVPLLCLQTRTYVCIVRTPRVCIFLVFRVYVGVPAGLIDFEFEHGEFEHGAQLTSTEALTLTTEDMM